ncbi:hypothetical protein PO909_005829 [Leuciscus waleckii]
MITGHNLYVLCLTETWVITGNYITLNESTPQDYCYKHEARLKGKGGGIARAARKMERSWKKTKLEVFRISWREHFAFRSMIAYRKALKTTTLLEENKHNPRYLFETVAKLTKNKAPTPDVSKQHSSNDFMNFFTYKIVNIKNIRSDTAKLNQDSLVVPLCSDFLTYFEPLNLATLTDIVGHMKPSNCPGDRMPSWFLKKTFDVIGPSVLSVINTSLSTGTVPLSLKHAVVQPLLKKPNLGQEVLSNFRPISKLPFLAKILEKSVFNQMQSFLDQNVALEMFQSGFKIKHNTESALLRVLNDIFLFRDSGHSVVLLLLDLTSAFDTIDHGVLISRLENVVGIHGIALKWFRSFLTNRRFSVNLGHTFSSSTSLDCGVPQGSILAPMLFALYMLPLGSIFRKYGISFHFFADDTQIYLPMSKNLKSSLDSLKVCLQEVKTWLSNNFLHLNESKTELVWFGGPALRTVPLLYTSGKRSWGNVGFLLKV